MRDKRTSIDAVVGEVRSGMTIGIGGWGSRRKPMAVVRELVRFGAAQLPAVDKGLKDILLDI